MKLSPRTGRPTESKKDIRLQIRVDQQTLDDLDKCAEKEKSNRSDIVRKGIQLVKSEQMKK